MSAKLKIIIADDHELVRTGLASVLDFEDDMEVVGTAKNGQVAARMVDDLDPDVVIMDMVMPVLGGIEATQRIREKNADVKILILTSYDVPEEINKALSAGANGALLKSSPNRDVLKAIRRVAKGKESIASEISEEIKNIQELPQLSDRQLEILGSVTRGLSNQDIATQLGISRGSVKKHLATIFERLGVATRAEAAAMALSRKIIKQ